MRLASGASHRLRPLLYLDKRLRGGSRGRMGAHRKQESQPGPTELFSQLTDFFDHA